MRSLEISQVVPCKYILVGSDGIPVATGDDNTVSIEGFDPSEYTWVENIPTRAPNMDNYAILAQISALETSLLRPLRELNATAIVDKSFAQAKVDDIEKQIQALRAELK